MKKLTLITALIVAFIMHSIAQKINNVKFEQSGNQIIITYDLIAPSNTQWQISVCASTDNGITWGDNLSNVTGDVGKGIKPGIDEKITWDVLSEHTSLTGTLSFKVKAEGNISGDIEMVFVQGGSFTMGSIDGESDEKPVHMVTLSDFYIGKTEITQKQWRDIMDSNPSSFTNCDNCPVEQVSWDDIENFLQKLNRKTGKTYRLPTESEWEYAARGGKKSNGYKYGGSNSLGDVAWFTENSNSKTHPVAQLQPNELGIYDMSGNVWEWCNDWYGDYTSYTQTNPKGHSTGSFRVFRGGSWRDFARYCRVAYRFSINPDSRYRSIGIRLVSPN